MNQLCEMLGHHYEWWVVIHHGSPVREKRCNRCGEPQEHEDTKHEDAK